MGKDMIIWASSAHIHGKIKYFFHKLTQILVSLFYNTVRQTYIHFINAFSWIWMRSCNMDQCGNVNDGFKCTNEDFKSDLMFELYVPN